jgi:hypothetical protein
VLSPLWGNVTKEGLVHSLSPSILPGPFVPLPLCLCLSPNAESCLLWRSQVRCRGKKQFFSLSP